jgi:hypothetical protein
MDELQKFVDDNLLGRKNILSVIDDYSIFSYYIGEELELRTKYSSPLRDGDEDPSFSLFYSKYFDDVIMFKDSANNIFGNVFDFVEAYLNLDSRKALLQINSDLKLGLDGEDVGDFTPYIVKSKPIKKHPTIITINKNLNPTPEFKEYWKWLEISNKTLDKFYARSVRVIHYKNEDGVSTIVPKILTISYEILGTYKIYQPFADKKFKFRNNFPDNYVEGALQLSFTTDFCIITKSSKECMFLDEHFGWESVAGKSETTQVPVYFMEEILRKKYKTVFIWLDNDDTGKKAQSKYLEDYPWLVPIEFDDYIEVSDPTDLFSHAKKLGQKEVALEYLKNLILKNLIQ